ncbi:hypothetical protein, partial [Ileibacterium valens]
NLPTVTGGFNPVKYKELTSIWSLIAKVRIHSCKMKREDFLRQTKVVTSSKDLLFFLDQIL